MVGEGEERMKKKEKDIRRHKSKHPQAQGNHWSCHQGRGSIPPSVCGNLPFVEECRRKQKDKGRAVATPFYTFSPLFPTCEKDQDLFSRPGIEKKNWSERFIW